MQNFSAEFRTPAQYIIDITYQIWEERGVGRIHDWYAPKSIVRTPHGFTTTVDEVVQHTLATMHVFPDREIFAEDVIIGNKAEGFYSSHRARSTATHQGAGAFGPATNKPVTLLAIADCLCRDNQVVEEWLIRDQAAIAAQLGLDPLAHGRAMGKENPQVYAIGNEAMRRRWADPDGLTIAGEDAIANRIINTCSAIWNEKKLHVMEQAYDRAVRFEGPAGHLCYGRSRMGHVITGVLSSIPDGRFEPHHIIVHREADKAVRVALRWSYCGTHAGNGRYGTPSGSPLALLGISHFELRDGAIVREWLLIDETALYAQIAAYHLD